MIHSLVHNITNYNNCCINDDVLWLCSGDGKTTRCLTVIG